MTARAYRIILAIAGLALLGGLLWHNLAGPTRPFTEARDGEAQRIDAARSWQYDDDGRLAYRLDAPLVVDRDDGDRYRLDRPVARIIDTESAAPPWRVTAIEGWVERTGGIVDLEGDVLASRAPFGTSGRLEMHTEALRVHPNEHRADSQAPATLIERTADGDSRWTSDSENLALDWNTERLTQTGRVRDVYVPTDTP
ncbi:MAG: LPS export ABC transporter periplasmic protein LptC [Pseudomonadota bacterium]